MPFAHNHNSLDSQNNNLQSDSRACSPKSNRLVRIRILLEHLRTLWHHYFDHVDGLVFVIDSNDHHRLPLAKAELKGIYQYESLRHVPLVVLANKQDNHGALSAEIIAEKLDLTEWSTESYRIVPCCALTGDSLTNGFTMLAKMIRKRQKLRRRRTN